MEDKNNIDKCEQCGDELEYAAYVIGMKDGVLGGTGFVPVHEDWMLFCSRKCLREYLSEDQGQPRIDVRIP